MSALVWPDARKAVHTLIRETGLATPEYILPHPLSENLPAVNTFVQRSTEGYVDRVVWVAVDVYAVPSESMDIANALVTAIANQPHDVPGIGYLDSVEVEQVPTDVPRPDETEQTQFVLRVTARPV